MDSLRVPSLAEIAIASLALNDQLEDVSWDIRFPACANMVNRIRRLENAIDTVDLSEYRWYRYLQNQYTQVMKDVVTSLAFIIPAVPDNVAAWQLPLYDIASDMKNMKVRGHMERSNDILALISKIDVADISTKLTTLAAYHASLSTTEDDLMMLFTDDDRNIMAAPLGKVGNKGTNMIRVMLDDYDRMQRFDPVYTWHKTTLFLVTELKDSMGFMVDDMETWNVSCKKTLFSEFMMRPRHMEGTDEIMNMVGAMADFVAETDAAMLAKMFFHNV